MIGFVGDSKRLIRLTGGNIRNRHIPVTPLRGFLPTDCYGAANKKNGAGKCVIIHLEGLNRAIETDVGRDGKTGRPRSHFRDRRWIRVFFEQHGAKAGDTLEVVRIGDREYRMRIVRGEVRPLAETVKSPRVAEFFAGIGLVRLALENHGFKVVFANDIDPAKLKIYKANFGTHDFLLGDIHKINASDVPECDLFTASFPCNDLSIAGAWEGLSGKESSAFWGLVRILKDLGPQRPQLVLLERVPGFLMSRNGKHFETEIRSR